MRTDESSRSTVHNSNRCSSFARQNPSGMSVLEPMTWLTDDPKKRYLIIPVTDHAFKRTTIGYASWATDRDYEIVNEQVKPCDRHPNTESFGTQDTVCEVKGDRQRSRTRVREGECQMFTMGWQIRWCNHRLSALLVATNFSRSVFLFFLSGSLQTVFTQLLFMTKPGKQN